jgi:hypothetical protein
MLGKTPPEIAETRVSGFRPQRTSFCFDLCQKSRGSSPKRTNSIPASQIATYASVHLIAMS